MGCLLAALAAPPSVREACERVRRWRLGAHRRKANLRHGLGERLLRAAREDQANHPDAALGEIEVQFLAALDAIRRASPT